MPNCAKILQKARRSAANLEFAEALALAERLGFELARIRGSHRIYERTGVRGLVDLRRDARDGSKAKKRQVEQLLTLEGDLGISEER